MGRRCELMTHGLAAPFPADHSPKSGDLSQGHRLAISRSSNNPR